MTYCIIDIETTGNGLKGNKITEISIFKFDGETIVDEFTSLVNPECPIPYFITGLTGIDDETVRNAPIFSEISKQVLQLTQDCIFVAHAVNFDYGVIKEEFRQLGIDFIRKKLCTVRLSRKLIPGLNSYSLGKLCSAVGIEITDRHRARGDAFATVTLFKQLLEKPESAVVIKQFLNSRSQEATLPPNVDRKVVDAIPQKPGIYYFLNQQETIIYVGKAKNLKKRVLGHFYDKSNHEVRLCREVTHIDYELSGSELVALLMESAAIKNHFPKFNRAQKRIEKQLAILSYEDRTGIIRLGYANLKQVANPVVVLNNATQCRDFLSKTCKEFNLCPNFCQLSSSKNGCDSTQQYSCSGICIGNEPIPDYNKKVNKALKTIAERQQNLLLEEKGRTEDEKAVVIIKEGLYQGYGFIPNSANVRSEEDLNAFITRQKHTPEVERILAAHIQIS